MVRRKNSIKPPHHRYIYIYIYIYLYLLSFPRQFSVEQILKMNSELLNELIKARDSWPRTKIGEAFVAMAPYLKMYTTYVNNYDAAIETLTNCEKKNPKFANFLAKISQNASLMQFSLPSYLIQPVQRIPRWFTRLIRLNHRDTYL